MDQTEKLVEEKDNITIQKISEDLQREQEKVKVKKYKLKKVKKRSLITLDCVIAVFLVAPLVVSYWRVTWQLMTIYEQSHHNALPLWESYFFSIGILWFFALVRPHLISIFKNQTKSKKEKSPIRKFFDLVKSQFLRKFYTYAFSVVCIMHWRSTWGVGDMFLADPRDSAVVTGLCVVLLLGLRSFRNCIAPPFIVVLDNEDVTFTFPTRFRAKSTDKTSLYVLDCLFSVFIVGTLVVFVWRGAWALVDLFLFPNDVKQSSWISLILGYTIVAMAFSLQPAMRWLCDRLTGCWRIIVSDVFLFFSVVGTVNVWRGIWNLLDIYFLPDHPEISCWVVHLVCLILLILLNCSNSLLVRGVYIDAEEPAGKCVVFPCYYLRLIFKNERQKKHNRRHQLDILAKRKQELECLKTSCKCNSEQQNHVILLQHVLEPNHIEA